MILINDGNYHILKRNIIKMKKYWTIAITIFCSLSVKAQVQIRPLPVKGYEKRITTYINSIRVVDTHEHLANPSGYKNSGMLDFMLLLHHYADDDIKSAGMSKQSFEKLLTDSLTVMEKWYAIKPYWEGSCNTAYNRSVLLAVDSLYGIKNIDETTVINLSEKIKEGYKTDWFNHILKDKCNLEYVVVDGEDRSFGDPDMFRFVKRFDYISIDSKKAVEAIGKRQNVDIRKLDDLIMELEDEFHSAVAKGCVAIKIGIAYNRILFFEDVNKEKAVEVFDKIFRSTDGNIFAFEEVKPLQDYMTFRVLDLARKYNLPVQIHTGLQAGDGNIIDNSNPTHLANLFLKYRDVKFILFHGGYPFGGELATLAKNFRNVYIDMCWLYIISPSYSERYLHEWLETVPAIKIMAFGGDFHNVEGVYGHLLLAKQIVAKVLIDKVTDGYFTEDEAVAISKMLFHDNAVRILNLDKR
jgi:uncharacterized protein